MTDTLKLILDLVVRNANGGKRVADDVRRLRVEATGSSRPLNDYERSIDRVGKQALKSAGDVAKLRREIQDTNRIVLTDKRGAITGGSAGASQPGGGGLPVGLFGGVASSLGINPTLLKLGVGGIAAGAAGLAGRFVLDQSAEINKARAEIDGLHESLARMGISAGSATRPLRDVGLTSEQSARSVFELSKAGVRQDEIFGAAAFTYDLARRRQLDYGDAVELVGRTIETGNQRLAREIGLVNAGGFAKLTAEQRSRAFAAAISDEGAALDAFTINASGASDVLFEIAQARKQVGESIDAALSADALAMGRLELAATSLLAKLTRPFQSPEFQIIRALSFSSLISNSLFGSAQSTSGYGVRPTGAFVGPPSIAGPDAPSEGQLADRRRAAEQAELRRRSLAGVRSVEDQLALEGLSGFDKLREQNRQAREGLLKLPGIGQSDLSKVDEGFAARITREQDKQRNEINALIRESDTKALSSLVERAGKLKIDTDFTDIAKSNADERKKQEARRKEAEFIQIEVDAQEQLLRLRSRDGSEIRDTLALRLSAIERIAKLEGDTSRVALESLKARKDAEVQLAQLERDRLDRGRQAAESAFDALVSGGKSGGAAFLRSQVLGVGRTVTGNLAETLLKNSGTLGLDGLIPGQTKNGKLTPIGQALQGTFLGLNPADIQRRNIEALGLNTSATDRLTAVLAGRGGSDGAALTPLRSVASGADFLGLDWLRESSQVTADAAGTTSEATKETNQLLAKIVQTSIFGAAGAAGIAGGVRRGGVGGAVQTGAGIASTAGGIFKALGVASSFAGPLAAIGLGASLIGSFFGGQDPLKREKQIQDELNRNRFNAPESINREFDTFGRSVESGPNGVRHVTININAIDARSIMDHRAELAEAVRVGFNEDGGATYSDFRREFEG